MIRYADADCLLDLTKARSQIGYVLTYVGVAISWRSQKQTLFTTSSNHTEVMALHEVSQEFVWLRYVTQHIQATCRLPVDRQYCLKIMLHASLK